MLGFHHLSLKIEHWIIASYYNHNNSTIFKGLYFFMNNIFYNTEQKKKILENFCRVQRTRYVLLKAIKKYKIRKYSVNDCDLMMVPFTEYRDNLKIYITENKRIYTFYLPDLLKLWKRNILESEFMIISPKYLRNPYTNKLFSLDTLNYIYFSAFREMLIIPTVLTELFNSQYDKLKFIYKYGTMLQENAITSFINSNNLDLFKDVIIIKELYPGFTYNIDVNINDNTKKESLIKDMRRILLMYYELTYSTNFVKKETARLNFLTLLKEYNDTIPVEFRPEVFSDEEYNEIIENEEIYDSPLFTNEEGNYSSGNEEIHNLIS